MIILSNISQVYTGASSDAESVKRNVDLFIHDTGKISDLKPHSPMLSVGDEHALIDCSGYTVTPGLVDCHAHLTLLGVSDDDLTLTNSSSGILYFEKILHTTLVDGGVTTARDVGGATYDLKRLVDEGQMIGPRLKVSICMLSTTGGHGDFTNYKSCHANLPRLWPKIPGRPSNVVDGEEACRQRVREIIACGADLIKVCASSGVLSPTENLECREFTEAELGAICDEATSRGLKVAAHAHSKMGIEMAIKMGVYDLQHISFMDERLVEMAYDKGCTVTPTSWISHEVLNNLEGMTDSQKDKAQMAMYHHQQAVKFASRGGLKILAGTDPVMRGMHGRNYMEIEALIKDGVLPLVAWHGMTGLAAKEIGQHDAGLIRPGYRADLIVADANILEKPSLMQNHLIEVFKDGVPYRGAFDSLQTRTYSSQTDEFFVARAPAQPCCGQSHGDHSHATEVVTEILSPIKEAVE